MILAVVKIPISKEMDLDEYTAHADDVAPDFEGLPGLIRKNFLYSADEGVAGGIYCWESREAAEACYFSRPSPRSPTTKHPSSRTMRWAGSSGPWRPDPGTLQAHFPVAPSPASHRCVHARAIDPLTSRREIGHNPLTKALIEIIVLIRTRRPSWSNPRFFPKEPSATPTI